MKSISVSAIKEKIKNEKGQSIIVGIDGLGGSGKTTYSLDLQRVISNSILFHIDDFIHTKKIRYNENFEQWYCYYHLQWRYDDLINEVFKPLKNGLSVNTDIELYDKENDVYKSEKVEIPVGSIVLIEGVFLQRPELQKYFDYVIYLDVDKETRLGRVLKRDTYIGDTTEISSKYENRYFPAEQKYIEECNPIAQADFIIKG